MRCTDLVGALYCEECGRGGHEAARKAREIDEERDQLRGEVERLRGLCAEAAKTLRSSTHFDNCDCGCVHEAELHGRLIDAAGRGE